MPELKELLESRAKKVADARAVVERAKDQKRDLTAEERQTTDKLIDEASNLTREIDSVNDSSRRQDRLKDLEDRLQDSGHRVSDPPDPGGRAIDDRGGQPAKAINWRSKDLFNRTQNRGWKPKGARATPEYGNAFSEYVGTGRPQSLLQSDNAEQAGYLVPPEQFVTELIRDIDDLVFFRQMARTFIVRQARSLGAVKRIAKANTFNWSSEVGQPTPDTALAFGKRNLHPHHLTGSILITRDLMEASVIPMEDLVREEMAADAGEKEEDAFLTGSGHMQPLGVFTASVDGISTARDVSASNTTTAITFDGLIRAKYSLKAAYHRSSQWLFHNDALLQLALIKDGNGQYVWRESVRDGEPDRLLGWPIRMSSFVPNTFTASSYVGIVGDFNWYWIADALDMGVQRLNELYALQNMIAFVGRRKVDGMPVKEEAFTRIQLAAS